MRTDQKLSSPLTRGRKPSSVAVWWDFYHIRYRGLGRGWSNIKWLTGGRTVKPSIKSCYFGSSSRGIKPKNVEKEKEAKDRVLGGNLRVPKLEVKGCWEQTPPCFKSLGAPIKGATPNMVILIAESCANHDTIPLHLWLFVCGLAKSSASWGHWKCWLEACFNGPNVQQTPLNTKLNIKRMCVYKWVLPQMAVIKGNQTPLDGDLVELKTSIRWMAAVRTFNPSIKSWDSVSELRIGEWGCEKEKALTRQLWLSYTDQSIQKFQSPSTKRLAWGHLAGLLPSGWGYRDPGRLHLLMRWAQHWTSWLLNQGKREQCALMQYD